MQTILLQVCSTGIALKSASEMTYIVSRGALNSTHSLIALKDRGAIAVLQHLGPQFWGPAIVSVVCNRNLYNL